MCGVCMECFLWYICGVCMVCEMCGCNVCGLWCVCVCVECCVCVVYVVYCVCGCVCGIYVECVVILSLLLHHGQTLLCFGTDMSRKIVLTK